MGDFNTTCFASHQSIGEGARCRVIPIIQAASFQASQLMHGLRTSTSFGAFASLIGVDRFWSPVGSFFEAIYHEQSGVYELQDTPANRLRLGAFLRSALAQSAKTTRLNTDAVFDLGDYLKKRAPALLAQLSVKQDEFEEGSPELDDIAFEQGCKCWDVLVQACHYPGVFWNAVHGGLRPMSFAAIHQAAYDTLLEDSQSWKMRDGMTREMRAWFQHKLDVLRESSNGSKRRAFRLYQWHDFQTIGAPQVLQEVEFELLDRVRMRYGDGTFSDDELFDQVRPWLSDRHVLTALDALNLHFEPAVYNGDMNNFVGRSFTQFVAKVAQRVA